MKSCKCDHGARDCFLCTPTFLTQFFSIRLVRLSFDFSAKEVLEFCKECVLNEDENSECEVPEAFYGQVKP
jgi:hypothetical protein